MVPYNWKIKKNALYLCQVAPNYHNAITFIYQKCLIIKHLKIFLKVKSRVKVC